MGTKQALPQVDPLSLPVGFQVGPWRVKGWGGRGTYGTLYCVERVGHEAEGPFALKLAILPGDERFGREARLLSRIVSPHVPRFREQGSWVHPSGAFPYVVMEWVEGEPLYEWAARRNPTSRQVLRLLAQVARALEATHAAEGVHRDVKGDNVLVHLAEERAVLTDFGAGHYRGAATLTSKLMAPGTEAYRSPEAWAFVKAFERHPTAHYRASACDDLFALGVMAYRLVTDEYPPPTQPGESGAEVWRQARGLGPRAPRQLNPRVSPALEGLILRLLAVAPVERFKGRAREAAEALEYAAQGEGTQGDEPLFGWSEEHGPRLRSAGAARLAAQQEVAVREHQKAREARARSRAKVSASRARRWGFALGGGAAVAGGMLAAGLIVAGQLRGQPEAGSSVGNTAPDGSQVSVGDSAAEMQAPPAPSEEKKPMAQESLPEPRPGQTRPDKRGRCPGNKQVPINGACWLEQLPMSAEECVENGGELFKGKCYDPAHPSPKKTQPTSSPP